MSEILKEPIQTKKVNNIFTQIIQNIWDFVNNITTKNKEEEEEVKKEEIIIEKEKNFFNPKHDNSFVNYQLFDKDSTIYESTNIEEWVKNYFKENPNSDGIKIIMEPDSSTKFKIKFWSAQMIFN